MSSRPLSRLSSSLLCGFAATHFSPILSLIMRRGVSGEQIHTATTYLKTELKTAAYLARPDPYHLHLGFLDGGSSHARNQLQTRKLLGEQKLNSQNGFVF